MLPQEELAIGFLGDEDEIPIVRSPFRFIVAPVAQGKESSSTRCARIRQSEIRRRRKAQEIFFAEQPTRRIEGPQLDAVSRTLSYECNNVALFEIESYKRSIDCGWQRPGVDQAVEGVAVFGAGPGRL